MSTTAGNRSRLRVSIACDHCRRRKARCDAVTPVCGNCSRVGVPCVYRNHPRRSAEELCSTLDERLGSLEVLCRNIDRKVSHFSVTQSGGLKSYDLVNRTERTSSQPISHFQSDLENSSSLSNFNRQLACFKQSVIDISLSSIPYASNVFYSIFTPEDVKYLGDVSGDPLLWQRLEEHARAMWKAYQRIFSQLVDPPSAIFYDAMLFDRCVDIYKGMRENFLHILISPSDLDVGISSYPESIRYGIVAVIFIIGVNAIRMRSNTDIPHIVKSQEGSAYIQALQTLNWASFCKPGFLEVRLSLALLWIIVIFSSLPSVSRFLGSMIDMARAIGLDSPEINSKFSTAESGRREYVWMLVLGISYSLSIHLSASPFITDEGVSYQGQKVFTVRVAKNFEYFSGIHCIYADSFTRLFSVQARKVSLQQIIEEVLRLDRELSNWRASIQENLWNISVNENRDIQGCISSFPWVELRAQYYHTVILVHSITAFSAHTPLEIKNLSLKKVSEAAHLIFDDCVREYRALGLPERSATTAYLCVLLQKILQFPNDDSTREDIKAFAKVSELRFQSTWPFDDDQDPFLEMVDVLNSILSMLLDNGTAAIDLSSPRKDETEEFSGNLDDCCIS